MKLYNSIALNYDNDENDHGSFGVGNIDLFFFQESSLSLLILLSWPLYENL